MNNNAKDRCRTFEQQNRLMKTLTQHMKDINPSPERMMRVMQKLLGEMENLTTMEERFTTMEEALVDTMERLDQIHTRLENQALAAKALYDKVQALAGLIDVTLPPMLPMERRIKPEPIPRP